MQWLLCVGFDRVVGYMYMNIRNPKLTRSVDRSPVHAVPGTYLTHRSAVPHASSSRLGLSGWACQTSRGLHSIHFG